MNPFQSIKPNGWDHKKASFGLIGYPLSHSLSPAIHTAAIRAHNLDGDYRLYAVPPSPEDDPQLARLLEKVREGMIHGLNVTIPHKENVLPLLDELTESAQAIRAVNTVYLQDGFLWGDNTDAPGFWADVKPLLENRDVIDRAVVLGAGGSARAICYALLSRGYRATILARRIEQAVCIVEHFSLISDQAAAATWEDLPDHVQQPCLIVNTTPLGMHLRPWQSPWPDNTPFPDGSAVYDLVYNPSPTRLVLQARLAGIPARNGLGMLVEQAALSFERWTSLEAPREAMSETAAEFGQK